MAKFAAWEDKSVATQVVYEDFDENTQFDELRQTRSRSLPVVQFAFHHNGYIAQAEIRYYSKVRVSRMLVVGMQYGT